MRLVFGMLAGAAIAATAVQSAAAPAGIRFDHETNVYAGGGMLVRF